jgi:hypothetical protein
MQCRWPTVSRTSLSTTLLTTVLQVIGTVHNRTKIQQAFDDFINHSNGAILRAVFIFDPSTNRFLQVVMRPARRRMQWTIVVINDEAELDIAVAKYQDSLGSQKFGQGELLTRACICELTQRRSPCTRLELTSCLGRPLDSE